MSTVTSPSPAIFSAGFSSRRAPTFEQPDKASSRVAPRENLDRDWKSRFLGHRDDDLQARYEGAARRRTRNRPSPAAPWAEATATTLPCGNWRDGRRLRGGLCHSRGL
jgi:hypothetical protein